MIQSVMVQEGGVVLLVHASSTTAANVKHILGVEELRVLAFGDFHDHLCLIETRLGRNAEDGLHTAVVNGLVSTDRPPTIIVVVILPDWLGSGNP